MKAGTETLPRRPSVLIVSDDPIARSVLARHLQAAGNQVCCTDSPTGVLMATHLEVPDLVVLYPGARFSGPMLYQHLRTQPMTRDVPILLVARPEALAGFVTRPEAGLFASKPIRLDHLASRVQGLVQMLVPLSRGGELARHAARASALGAKSAPVVERR